MWAGTSIGLEIQGKHILDGVDARVRPGSVVAVLGPNGAGKSTLLKILTGELSAGQGSVELEGKPLAEWRGRGLARKCAVMGQQTDIPFPILVRDVVLLGRSPHFGWRETEEDLEIAATALRQVELETLAGRLFPSLSGGEKQRVQLARALAQIENGRGDLHGQYLFMDEPVASLDLKHQHEVFLLARGLARRGAGVFAVLHDLNLALGYADEILVLRGGRVAAAGSPEEALRPEVLEDVFEVAVSVDRDGAGRPLFIRHRHR